MDNLEDLEDQIFKFEDRLLTNPKANCKGDSFFQKGAFASEEII